MFARPGSAYAASSKQGLQARSAAMRARLWGLIAVGLLLAPAHGTAQAGGAAAAGPAACVPVNNVDSCWEDGVAAERRKDGAAALAAYVRSCDAALQQGGCYEAGKRYLLDPAVRDGAAAEPRLRAVCDSDDVGLGPYACKYLGLLYRDGIGVAPQPALAVSRFARACFLHNAAPFIDGEGCALLAERVLAADDPSQSGTPWPRDYVAYLAYAMGCTDGMPAQCGKAQALYARAVAGEATWLARCEDVLGGRAPAGTCPLLADPAVARGADARQAVRRTLVDLFREATGQR
ncbi:hypothetical protein QE400_002862 [Xanthomonas sacchari]|uniref:hypothetical protein n=1 Tax=Xanthomonas sacchari TaxID=56458 RepID=UPI00277F8EBC|nr:hypothetical protein [Xanthomonas sacchari]MDQ1093449.1 hypothetical protein [Xanthomonas sacchari]